MLLYFSFIFFGPTHRTCYQSSHTEQLAFTRPFCTSNRISIKNITMLLEAKEKAPIVCVWNSQYRMSEQNLCSVVSTGELKCRMTNLQAFLTARAVAIKSRQSAGISMCQSAAGIFYSHGGSFIQTSRWYADDSRRPLHLKHTSKCLSGIVPFRTMQSLWTEFCKKL